MYNILEAKIEFENSKLYKITVLVEMSKNDVRAIVATTKPRSGYMHIPPKAEINSELLQQVAGKGMETVDRDEVFKNWKSKYSKDC